MFFNLQTIFSQNKNKIAYLVFDNTLCEEIFANLNILGFVFVLTKKVMFHNGVANYEHMKREFEKDALKHSENDEDQDSNAKKKLKIKNKEENGCWFIAIHVGAGFHSQSLEKQYLTFIDSILTIGKKMVRI